MSKRSPNSAVVLLITVGTLPFSSPASTVPHLPDPVANEVLSPATHKETAVLAGGCFWGLEAVFESLKGVSDVVSGYAGGSQVVAHYDIVSTGLTGHAESVQITFDPAQISYGQLLKIFFSVAHDPTQLNRQGPDTGTQYRSSIFYTSEDQKRVAEAYLQQLRQAQVFNHAIVTKVVPLQGFYAAEDYHQNFIARNPTYPYVVFNDLPKLKLLREQFPALVKSSHQ